MRTRTLILLKPIRKEHQSLASTNLWGQQSSYEHQHIVIKHQPSWSGTHLSYQAPICGRHQYSLLYPLYLPHINFLMNTSITFNVAFSSLLSLYYTNRRTYSFSHFLCSMHTAKHIKLQTFLSSFNTDVSLSNDHWGLFTNDSCIYLRNCSLHICANVQLLLVF